MLPRGCFEIVLLAITAGLFIRKRVGDRGCRFDSQFCLKLEAATAASVNPCESQVIDGLV
jgi:hypothetical protein